MTKFKICGIKDAMHARIAAEVGADFIGFVFVPGVRRQITFEQAKSILLEYRSSFSVDGPKLVGLFLNQSVQLVNRIVEECRLDMVQLCGNEPPEYWSQIIVPIVKQIKIRDDNPLDQSVAETEAQIVKVESAHQIPLLDKYVNDHVGGGSGLAFDWNVAAGLSPRHDFLLAGGLKPNNVLQAIVSVNPWAVDVSSGVETRGVKDPKKIKDFADAVREADLAIN
ncbi:phosphoribosylanthranilate isomerase [Dehalococcoidia bacterium]|nr:phosphoribosylanthranilate isomerase [Dehalococcoidia bacterium]